MINYRQNLECLNCADEIYQRVHEYSVQNYGFPLCRDCQADLRDKLAESTEEAVNLYFALRVRGVPAELEKNDGFKTIDIAVTEAKVNIEVDGLQHNYSYKQAKSDLQRTYYSFKKGYFTLRVPNALVRKNLDEAADLITEFLIESRDRTYKRRY